jgi:uncharacterized membrane protein
MARHREPDVSLAGLRESIRSGLWFIPSLFAIGAVVLALVTGELDRWLATGDDRAFTASIAPARDVLATIAAAMLSFIGLVFTITIVALQLASSQFSPRVLRTFLRDRGSQVSLGVFVATFVYALVMLRVLASTPDTTTSNVPGASETIALALSLISLATFVYYVNHIAQSIRAVAIIEAVAHESRLAINEERPVEPDSPAVGSVPDGPPDATITNERGSGVLLGIDVDDLVELAAQHDSVLVLRRAIGDYVARSRPLLDVYGSTAIDFGAIRHHVGIGPTRTMQQDVSFGFRQLVDIAERALSPAVNDPTTAVQCVDRLESLLFQLRTRPDPTGRHADGEGRLRVVEPVARWEDFVGLAFDEIRIYGADSLQIHRRLRAALIGLIEVVDDERKPPLVRQLDLLDRSARRHFPDEEDLDHVTRADSQGAGGPGKGHTPVSRK